MIGLNKQKAAASPEIVQLPPSAPKMFNPPKSLPTRLIKHTDECIKDVEVVVGPFYFIMFKEIGNK